MRKSASGSSPPPKRTKRIRTGTGKEGSQGPQAVPQIWEDPDVSNSISEPPPPPTGYVAHAGNNQHGGRTLHQHQPIFPSQPSHGSIQDRLRQGFDPVLIPSGSNTQGLNPPPSYSTPNLQALSIQPHVTPSFVLAPSSGPQIQSVGQYPNFHAQNPIQSHGFQPQGSQGQVPSYPVKQISGSNRWLIPSKVRVRDPNSFSQDRVVTAKHELPPNLRARLGQALLDRDSDPLPRSQSAAQLGAQQQSNARASEENHRRYAEYLMVQAQRKQQAAQPAPQPTGATPPTLPTASNATSSQGQAPTRRRGTQSVQRPLRHSMQDLMHEQRNNPSEADGRNPSTNGRALEVFHSTTNTRRHSGRQGAQSRNSVQPREADPVVGANVSRPTESSEQTRRHATDVPTTVPLNAGHPLPSADPMRTRRILRVMAREVRGLNLIHLIMKGMPQYNSQTRVLTQGTPDELVLVEASRILLEMWSRFRQLADSRPLIREQALFGFAQNMGNQDCSIQDRFEAFVQLHDAIDISNLRYFVHSRRLAQPGLPMKDFWEGFYGHFSAHFYKTQFRDFRLANLGRPQKFHCLLDGHTFERHPHAGRPFSADVFDGQRGLTTEMQQCMVCHRRFNYREVWFCFQSWCHTILCNQCKNYDEYKYDRAIAQRAARPGVGPERAKLDNDIQRKGKAALVRGFWSANRGQHLGDLHARP